MEVIYDCKSQDLIKSKFVSPISNGTRCCMREFIHTFSGQDLRWDPCPP